MKLLRPVLIILAMSALVLGCGKSMTIVKAHPSNSYYSAAPGAWRTDYNSGLAHYNKKEYTKALECYLAALKQADNNDDDTRGWLYYSIGLCHENLKEIAKAKQNYIMAQNLDPNLTEAADGIARISKQMAEKN